MDYFYVDTTSQISHRPVIINMEMPEGADYAMTIYDENGNQVGMAVENEDGTKIPFWIPSPEEAEQNWQTKEL